MARISKPDIHSDIEPQGRLAQVGEAFSLGGGRTIAYHAFTGWRSYLSSMREFVKSTGFSVGETERIGRPS